MSPKLTIILAFLAVAGLLSGFAARRISSAGLVAASQRDVLPAPAAAPHAGSPTDDRANSQPPEIQVSRSTDTVDSILTADAVAEYPRIARWLATASEQDLASFWRDFQKGNRDADITDLIFINWTRLNPQAAIACGNGYSAWQAWAATDPAAALAAALAVGKEQAGYVATGIGRYDPEWLRKHFEELPESARHNALAELERWQDTANPLESLEFTRKTGGYIKDESFRNLARNDPWAALDWLKANPTLTDSRTSPFGNFAEILFSTMAEERPAELDALAARTPAGAMRRQMEQALFDSVLETDPAAALELARAVEAPLVAAQRLGQIGLGMIATDPDNAFEIAREILAANPGEIAIGNQIEYENGSISIGASGKATELMDALFEKDRERTLAAMGMQTNGENKLSGVFSTYAGKWAEDDLDGFMDWTDLQSGPPQQVSSERISYKLVKMGDYSGAIEWAGRGTQDPDSAYSLVLLQWQGADPEAAATWVENSGLTNEQKDKYKDFLKRAAP